jgi:hypothetical protein
MGTKEELKWSDLVSPTMTPEDYLKSYGEKIAYNYKTYEPKKDVLEDINKILKSKNQQLKIVALGADWCPDCSLNIPRMIKIIKFMKSGDIDFRILYGIMVNALHKPGDIIWHKTRSPPEAINSKFKLSPTFFPFSFQKIHQYLYVRFVLIMICQN